MTNMNAMTAKKETKSNYINTIQVRPVKAAVDAAAKTNHPIQETISSISSAIISFVKSCFGKTDIHGIQYVTTNDDVSFWEKIFWFIILLIASVLSIWICLLFANTYNDNTIRTVLENSIYPVFKTVFPALTVCSSNRLNWNRFDIVKQLYLPQNYTKEMEQFLENLVKKFENLKYGEFSDFSELFESNANMQGSNKSNLTDTFNYDILDKIDLYDVIRIMSKRCDEIFVQNSCKWVSRPKNCCQIFGFQKNKFGFCQTFNSVLNEHSLTMMTTDSSYPFRLAKGSTPSNGLSFTVKTDKAFKRKGRKMHEGFYIMLHKHTNYNGVVAFIPIEVDADIKIHTKLIEYDAQTRKFSPEVRNCFFDDERTHKDFHILPGLNYSRYDCIAECQRSYTQKYCNCCLDIFFPLDHYRNCKISDLKCLANYAEYLKNPKFVGENQFFGNERGLNCYCLQNCIEMEYEMEIKHLHYSINETKHKNTVTVNINFHQSSFFKFRSHAAMDQLKLVVDIGGIAGLLLGCSLITFVEIIYFFTTNGISVLRKWFKI